MQIVKAVMLIHINRMLNNSTKKMLKCLVLEEGLRKRIYVNTILNKISATIIYSSIKLCPT